jgi:hypothetical protein
LFSAPLARAQSVVSCDVCVYGGTSGGVAAAVAAVRLGKSVALVSLNNHVGGMTASGLGVTDIGPGNNATCIGGIAKEFYKRVGQAYGSVNPVYYFEPRVAENVFWQMLSQASVPVYTNQRLATVSLATNHIVQFTTQDGTVFRAQQFVDTTYEGDLMAAAGVTFTFGREGTSAYTESMAGIRPLGGSYNYDPYLTPGNPASGLLPLVQPGNGGTVGQGDTRLQAYNFRLCLTQIATNKIAITPPTGYSESQYELVKRYLAARVAQDGAVSLDQLIHIQTIIPNGKTDINANGELSTDYVGYNYTWATNTCAQRDILRQQHEDYIRGLLHFLATSTNVPYNVRTNMQSWGLAKDEFKDTGGWPWQIYVREARRMVSDYVMLQQDALSQRTAPDPIALAAYVLDSHGVQRVASGGYSRWEGGVGGTPPHPYGISYRAHHPARWRMSERVLHLRPVRQSRGLFFLPHGTGLHDDQPGRGHRRSFCHGRSCPRTAAQLRQSLHPTPRRWPALELGAAAASTNGIFLDQGGPGTSYSAGWTAGANAGGWNGDYWHDGLVNLMEYGMSLSPMTPNPNALAPVVENGLLRVSYTQSKTATDVSLLVEQSEDLITWRSGPAYVQQVSAVDRGATVLITVQLARPIGARSVSFLRLRVTELP